MCAWIAYAVTDLYVVKKNKKKCDQLYYVHGCLSKLDRYVFNGDIWGSCWYAHTWISEEVKDVCTGTTEEVTCAQGYLRKWHWVCVHAGMHMSVSKLVCTLGHVFILSWTHIVQQTSNSVCASRHWLCIRDQSGGSDNIMTAITMTFALLPLPLLQLSFPQRSVMWTKDAGTMAQSTWRCPACCARHGQTTTPSSMSGLPWCFRSCWEQRTIVATPVQKKRSPGVTPRCGRNAGNSATSLSVVSRETGTE